MNFCHFKSCLYSDPSKCKDNSTLKFTKCIQCNAISYCSNNCKIQDWSIHKQQCAGAHVRAISELNKSENNITINTSDISGKSSFLQSRKSLKDYELVNGSDIRIADLGKGAYGSVKLVKEKSSNKLFALKIVNKKNLIQNAKPEYLKREIKLQKSLDHPHIIKLFHTFEDNENVYLVLEYAKNGSLFFHLRKKKKYDEKEAFVFFFQTSIGIDYLHKKGILHRDIKPENLLLDEKGNIKLCDFGWCADNTTETRNTFCGTLDYMAPEMLKNQSHDKTVDLWSLGVLLYELLHGYAPFGGINERDKIMKITNYDFKMGENISTEARDLIASLMKTNPKERIDFTKVFNHPWLKKFETSFKMDMSKFIYDPNKSKSRSRSRSPNVSNIQIDKPKDNLNNNTNEKNISSTKNDDSHKNRFATTTINHSKMTQEDKRGRSNSPITNDYHTNNLGRKDLETSINNSNNYNNSNIKNNDVKINDKVRLEIEKKNSMIISSKSVENIKPLIQNPILNSTSRETSMDRLMKPAERNNDRSKSPGNRNKIFDTINKGEINKKFVEETKFEPIPNLQKRKENEIEKKNSYKSTSKTNVQINEKNSIKSSNVVANENNKNSYKAAKFSEVDDSILKELEKAKKIEDQLERIMRNNKDLYSQLPNKYPNDKKNMEITTQDNRFLNSNNNLPQSKIEKIKLNEPNRNNFTEFNQRNKISNGLDDPMNYKRIERDRSNSPLKTELLIRKNEEKSFQNKIEETSNQVKKNEIDFEQKNLIKEKRDPSEEDISKKDIKITERKRSLSPVNDNQNYDFKQNTSKNVENHSKRTETIKKENMSPKFAGSKEKNESKHNLNNLNESMIPLNTETMNFSMQNDSTSEFLMNELNSQKKNPNNYKPYSNKNMSVINEQNEEENLKNHKKIEEEKENNYEKEEKLKKLRKIEEEKFKNQKKKNPPFQNTLTEEDNRTTHISKYLDKIMVEMNIDDNHDNKILKTLYGLTQSKGSVKHDDKNLEKINQEVLTTKKNENLTKNLRKADNPSEFISSKSRSELTFAENNSSQRKETNKKENQFEKDVDDIGNEVSEEETSKRNTEMHKRNMEENINKNKNKHKNVNGIKIQKEDWMNTDEDSLDDEDMNNYFKQFEKERKISEEKEDFLPKFGISKKDEDLERKLENKINKMKDFKDSKDQKVKNDQFIEMNLDKKISESQNQFNQKNEENIDHSDFNFKSRKKDQNFKEITLHDHPLYKETKALKKTIPISKVKNKINEEELLEIHDSDLDKENTIVNEEELNRSLRDNGNKNLKKKGSLNNSLSNNSKKLIEQMKSLKAEELIHEGYETFKKEEKSENEEENFPNTLSKKKDNLKKKVEKSQQTSSNANNLLKLEKKLKKTKDLTENPKDYENERENAMKKFYNSFALIEEGKFDRNGEKLYYSFDDKTTQQIEEKNSEIGSDSNESEERSQKPQTKRKKSRNKQKYFNDDENKLEKIIQSKLDKALLDPQIAKKWLKNQNYDKNLDMNFLPKTLANNSLNNYKDSNERLKKKNDQLKVLMQNIDSDEDDSKRISKISKRSYITEKNVNVKSLEEMGFFEKLLFSLGCFKRGDVQSRKRSKEEKTKEYKKNKKNKK